MYGSSVLRAVLPLGVMSLAAPALPREFQARVERFWFVCVDTARLRPALLGRARLRAAREFIMASRSVGVRVVASVIACGVRAVVAAPSPAGVRVLVRRFCARTAKVLPGEARWRSTVLIAAVRLREIEAYAAFVHRCELSFLRSYR